MLVQGFGALLTLCCVTQGDFVTGGYTYGRIHMGDDIHTPICYRLSCRSDVTG